MHRLGNARTDDPHGLSRPGRAGSALDVANEYMMNPTDEQDERPALHGPGVVVTRPHGSNALPPYLRDAHDAQQLAICRTEVRRQQQQNLNRGWKGKGQGKGKPHMEIDTEGPYDGSQRASRAAVPGTRFNGNNEACSMCIEEF